MKVSIRLAMITALLVAMITITTLCLTHPPLEKQRSSKNAPSLGIPIVFAQVPSTINNSLPPSDIISWVETNQTIDLSQAQQRLQQLCEGFDEITNDYIDCYLTYYPFKDFWYDSNDFVKIHVRIYRNGLIVTYVPHVDKRTLVLSLNITQNSVKLQTDVVLITVANLLGIRSISESSIYHGTSVYKDAKYMEILWSNLQNLNNVPYVSTSYGDVKRLRLGMYVIRDNSSILEGFLVWLMKDRQISPYDWDYDNIYIYVRYNETQMRYLNLATWIHHDWIAGYNITTDMTKLGLLNIGSYGYWIEDYEQGDWDEVYTQVVIVLLLKG